MDETCSGTAEHGEADGPLIEKWPARNIPKLQDRLIRKGLFSAIRRLSAVSISLPRFSF